MATNSRHQTKSSTKSAKVAERLRKKIEDGEYYEALQTYKALYSRYRAQGKDKEAIGMIFDGAVTLLQHEQWECGNELAMTLISFYKEKKMPFTEETFQSTSHLFHLYNVPARIATGADSIDLRLKDLADVTPRELFARAALKWSSMVDEGDTSKYGHPKLHQMMARQYWKEKQYPLSGDHFLHAEDPDKFAEMLVEFSTTYGYPSERDLFIVRAVLQLLVLKKPLTALNAYHHFISMHPLLSHLHGTPPYEGEPALNFGWFLLHSAVYLKEFTADILEWIKRNYKGVIERDPSFSDYVDKIGVTYCGIAPPPEQPKGGGLMGLMGGPGAEGIFGSLMNSLSGPTPMAINEEPSATYSEPPQISRIDSDDGLD